MRKRLERVFQAIGHFEVRLHSFRQRVRSVQDLLGSTNENQTIKERFQRWSYD